MSYTSYGPPLGVGYERHTPLPWYRYDVVTEVTELSGKGIKVIQRSHYLLGRVWFCTELTNLPGVEYDVAQKSQTSLRVRL